MCVYSQHLTHASEQTANYKTCKPGDVGKHKPTKLTHPCPGLSRNEPLMMDSILEDKELMKKHVDLQKRSRYSMCIPNAWRPFFAARRYE